MTKKYDHGTKESYKYNACRCEPCKIAQSIASKIYYQKNSEARRQYKRDYYKIHAPEENAKSSEWYQNNKEHIQSWSKQYRQDNKEKISQRNKLWYQNNRDKILEQKRQYDSSEEAKLKHRIRESRRRAKIQNFNIPYSSEQLLQKFEYWGNRCWMCKGTDGLTIDHVKPISKDGWDCLSNIRPACKSCNSSKGNNWPSDWSENGIIVSAP